jgi:uncharacterized membrane protein YfcA
VSLPPLAYALLPLVGFAAGFVDSVAGGGGLLTVPALLTAGLPPHVALGTNKGQAVFGALSSTAGYARRGYVDWGRAPLAFVSGFVGSLVGAFAQLAVRPGVLRPVVIALLIAAAVVVAWPRPHATRAPLRHARLWGTTAAFLLGAYDGFFGPGVGTMLLVASVLVYADPLARASGNAKVVNLAANLSAFVLFTLRGNVLFAVALPMAAANMGGAWVGSHMAVRRGDKFIRGVVLAVVGVLVVKLATDLRGGG